MKHTRAHPKQEDLERLARLAKQACRHSYSPYSGVRVGAAILASDGRIFTGSNIENSSYGLTICAERVAATKAVSSGSRSFRMVAVASNLRGFTFPCGACRQFLAEFSDDLQVILVSQEGRSKSFRLKELLPGAFSLRSKRGSKSS
jgi:cytidine deaminase